MSAEKAMPWLGGEEYDKLSAPFDHTFHDTRGGVQLEYITGEQCVTRLNEVLGAGGWSFRVVEHGFNAEADEYWVLGELTAWSAGDSISRMQFGSQKCKRSRSSGVPLDIGFDLKGAGTDCLKKCASLIGVGLYLSKKEEQAPRPEPTPINAARPTPPRPAGPVPAAAQQAQAAAMDDEDAAFAAFQASQRAAMSDAAMATITGNPTPVPRASEEFKQFAEGPRPAMATLDPDAIPFDGGEPSAPTCMHGPRVYREGVSGKTGKPYKMWACPSDDRANQCQPEWVR
jgi:hypothetical protein